MRFIKVELTSKNDRTNRYVVSTKEDGIVLGRISWMGSWRTYAFFPAPHTLFERKCLRDLADLVESLTKEQREGKHGTRREK